MKKVKIILMVIILATFSPLQQPAEAQFVVPHTVFGMGGPRLSDSSYRVIGTVGEPVIGATSSSSYISEVGFSSLARHLITSTEDSPDNLPTKYRLQQNYPNPFNPTTKMRYELPKRSNVSLKIYDILGRQVAVLVDEEKAAGRYEVRWDAGGIASGVYFYRIRTGNFVETKKLILLR